VTFEARLAFLLFFFLCWAIVGLLPWAAFAAVSRGRGALLALPTALAAACAAGILVPMLGQRDVTGFWLSLCAAVFGGAAGAYGGITFARRLESRRSPPQRPPLPHPIGARRPAAGEAPAPQPEE
jgi:hypothetical protein